MVAVQRNGQVAEWSCSGLQSRVRRFDSDPGLHCEERKKAPLWRFIFLRIRHVLSRYVTRACLRFLAGVPECVHCYEGGQAERTQAYANRLLQLPRFKRWPDQSRKCEGKGGFLARLN